MSIGAIIKKLRRERDITQEQLAEYMNISAPAISQWECDRSAPDISQLPLLSNIFNVTTDFLLGVDISNKEKAIEKIIDEVHQYSKNGYYTEAEEIIRRGLREYPASHQLMNTLMFVIYHYPYHGVEFNQTKCDEINSEIIILGTKILAESSIDSIRHSAIQLLCYTYPNIGKTDEAEKLACSMPSMTVSCENLLRHIYKGDKRFRQVQRLIRQNFDNLVNEIERLNAPLDDGTKPYTLDEMIEIYKKIIAISEILFDDGNFFYFEISLAEIYLDMALIYAELNKCDDVINTLLKAMKHAVKSDTKGVSSDNIYTSLVFRGLNDYGMQSHHITDNASFHLLNTMAKDRFDFIRSNAEFIKIESELKKYAKKH